MQGVGCRVQGVGCRVQGVGCRVQSVGCLTNLFMLFEKLGEIHFLEARHLVKLMVKS